MSSRLWWTRCDGNHRRSLRERSKGTDLLQTQHQISGSCNPTVGARVFQGVFYTNAMSIACHSCLKIRFSPLDRPKIPVWASCAGFTIIELMVTLVVLGFILAIGLPSLRGFMVRNQTVAVTTQFSSDVARARSEAIGRNNCVTICMSSNTANALTGGTPTCALAGSNWQAGWIIFSNPSCSAGQNNPTTVGSSLISVRQAGADTFELAPASGAALRRLTFDSRGLAAGVQKNLTLAYLPETTSSPHYRSLCLSSAGRVQIKEYAGVSACP